VGKGSIMQKNAMSAKDETKKGMSDKGDPACWSERK
jgi:hypothetical protein